MTRSETKRGFRGRLVASIFLATAVWGCGSKIDSGNTGSETHWLKSCDKDAECGEYSCLCGVCTRACDEQSECDERASVASYCASAPSTSACEGDIPARICLKGADTATNDAGDQTSEPEPLTICDGSDDVRWVYRSAGGFVPTEYAFTGVYGDRFAAIDGHCNFWAAPEAGTIVTGTITDVAVLESYEATEYGRLSRFADVESNWGCPDAGSSLIWDPTGALSGSQCGIPAELVDVQTAFDKGAALVTDLLNWGTRTQGPLRFLIVQSYTEGGNNPTPWPLDLDPTDMIPDSDLDGQQLAEPLAGIEFPPGARAEQLRAAQGENGTVFEYVGAQDSRVFRALVRDELPPKIAATLQARQYDASAKQWQAFKAPCQTSEECTNGLLCQEHTTAAGGGTACNTCVEPNDPDWLCRSNDDCCGGTVCCLDCGDQSGTCIAEPDPCPTCIANGSKWRAPNVCEMESCIPDAPCASTTCLGPCAEDNCAGCGRHQECWAAGCTWNDGNEYEYCDTLIIDVPPPEPCEVTATDETVNGVSVHLETDNCSLRAGSGGEFRYTVTLNQSLAFTTESSGGGCGLCGVTTDPETWTRFVIAGDGLSYCPECSGGCCAPTEAQPTSIDAQTIEGTIDWPGLQWNGPSDTGNEPEGEFPAGTYDAALTFALPGVGEVVATLPITVTPRASLTP